MERLIYDGRYGVTDDGRVISHVRETPCELSLNARNGRMGYVMVNIGPEGKLKVHYVHRLVAEAFIPNPQNLPCVNHLDGDTANNRKENLEWCTYGQNTAHARAMGRLMGPQPCPCIVCGEPTASKSGMCAKCQSKEAAKRRQAARLAALVAQFQAIDKERLTPAQTKAIELRAEGKTLEEIGDELGVSKQRVNQLLRQAAYGIKKELPLGVRKQIASLEKRINRKETQLKVLTADIECLTVKRDALREGLM